MRHECSHYKHIIQNDKERERDLPTPKMYFKQQPSLYLPIFSSNGYISVIHKEVKYVVFSNIHQKQPSDHSQSECDKYTESRMKENDLTIFKKDTKLLLVQENSFIFLSQYQTSSSNFVRLALHICQINSIRKLNIYVSWTQMEKKL